MKPSARQTKPPAGTPVQLRHRAEAQLRKQKKQSTAKTTIAKSEADPYRLLHELQVHQVELEMQNAELQKARDELEVTLEKYTDLYDFAPVGYFSLDQQGRIKEVNLTGTALLGVERSRLVNQPLMRFAAQASHPGLSGFLKQVFAETGKQICKLVLTNEDTGEFWARLVGNSAIAGSDHLKCCRVAVSDISALKRAEEAQDRLAAIVEFSDDAIIGKDLNSIITSWNKGARNIFGYTASEMVGSSIMRLIPADRQEEEKQILSKLRRGKSVQHFETVRQTKRGRLINVSITASPIRDASGKIIGASKVARDITQRKHAESASRRAEVLAASNLNLQQEIARRLAKEKALKQSELLKSQLLEQSRAMQEQLRQLSRQVLQAQEEERRRISRELHDVIAQTLTGINIQLAALKKEAALNREGFDHSITRTQKLVEHSVEIVHEFARELRPAVLDDLGLIPALHSYMKLFSKRTHLHVALKAFAGVEHIDSNKRTILYRVAQEALNNVARHAQASRVDVTIQKLRGDISMKIKDDGKSFSVERALPANGGKRLGLVGMRERVEMVGGKFAITSAPGQGTTIIAQIPLKKNRGGGRRWSPLKT